jgi:WD40 repeat protein
VKPLSPPLKYLDGADNTSFVLSDTRVATNKESNIWNVFTSKSSKLGSLVTNATFTPDGTRVITISGDRGTVKVLDAATGKLLSPPIEDQRFDHSLAFSSDGMQVILADVNNICRIWKLPLAPGPSQIGVQWRPT